MKYDAQLQELRALLPQAKNILVALPKEFDTDELAAGLALFLSLTQAGKEVSIITEGEIKVSHSHLFGAGKVQNKYQQTQDGNYTIILGGVVAPDGTVPSLQKLDWFPTGPQMKDLKLVFGVAPGQKFEPTFITPGVEGGKFDLIFVLGTHFLEDLGGIYQNQTQLFTNTYLVNVDNNALNTQFGKTNLVDTNASLSELASQIIASLQLPFDGDTATNILAGLFEATANLQGNYLSAETYEVVALALKAGGKKPSTFTQTTPPTPTIAGPTPLGTNFPPVPNYDLSKVFNPPGGTIESSPANFSTVQPAENQPSAEEVPSGEAAVTPGSDWLTPKIFKGGSIG